MTPARQILRFGLCLALFLGLLETYARTRIKSTPAGEALARYRPDGRPHAVFLGSSLTDAGISAVLLDSLQGNLQVTVSRGARAGEGFRSFNLALAGLSGSANYYLLFKDFILPRGRPDFLVVEAPGVPFFPSAERFQAEGTGLRVESFRTELMDFSDFRYLSGGFPGAAATLSFWLHKHWRAYHYRLEIQARIRERLGCGTASGNGNGNRSGSGADKEAVGQGPYRMAVDAFARFAENTRKELDRMERSGEGAEAARRMEAHLIDLAVLAQSRGVRLVVLKPPCPPMDGETRRVPGFAEYDRSFRALCDSLDVIYLDFSPDGNGAAGTIAGTGHSCGPYSYSDGIHLDAAGARRFTACVSRALSATAGIISPAPAVP